MDENRNSDGTFAPAEPLVGQAAVEEAQGFRPMPTEPRATEVTGSTIEEEVQRLKEKSAPELPQDIIEVGYQKDGERVDPNETVSLDRASTDLGKYHGEMNATAERHLSAEFRAEVLKQRADLIEAAPELSEQLGLDAAETLAKAEAAKAADQPTESNDAARPHLAEPATQSDAFDTIEGLEPELKEVLRKSPQARQFLELNAAQTEQAITTYKASTVEGQQTALATIFALMPQLATIPLEHWGAEMQKTAQMDPARAKLVADTASNFDAIQQRTQLIDHYRQSQLQSEFDSLKQQYSAASDKALGPMSVAEKMQMTEELADYIGEHGISRAQLVEAAKTNLLLHHPAFQALAKDAITYRRMQKAAKAVPTRTHAPIRGPGVASVATRGDAGQVRALERALSNATTQQSQLKIAAQLLRAKRAG